MRGMFAAFVADTVKLPQPQSPVKAPDSSGADRRDQASGAPLVSRTAAPGIPVPTISRRSPG